MAILNLEHHHEISLCGVGMSTFNYSHAANLKVRSIFNIKNSFCNIKTNEVTGLNNRKSAFSGRGGGTSSTNSLLFLENGYNTVSLEIGALGWFSRENLTSEKRNKFSKDAVCKLHLIHFDENQNKLLTAIEVSIDNNGFPIGKNHRGEAIVGKEVLIDNVEEGHIDSHYFNKFRFPMNMKLYKFSQKINISGIPEWEWVNSPPYASNNE